MRLVIEHKNAKPIYEQLSEQLEAQIVSGELPADFCLPSIRAIAKELNISVITTKTAYEILEKKDLIYTVAGKGCFVKPHHPRQLDDKKFSLATKILSEQLAYIKSLGINKEELEELIDKLYTEQK